MADITQKVVTKVIIDNSDALSALVKQEKAQEGVTKATEGTTEATKKDSKTKEDNTKVVNKQTQATEETTSALDGMANALGINTQALKGTVGGIKSVAKGFKVFNSILGASLIGVVALALAGMVSWMKRTEEGGDKLSVIMAGLNGVMEGVFDVLSSAGKIAFEVITTAIDVLFGTWTLLVNSIVEKSLIVQKAWAKLTGNAEDLVAIEKELNTIREESKEVIDGMVTSIVDSGKAIVDESKVLVENVKAIEGKTKATIELQKIENALTKTIRKNTVDEAKRRNEIQKNLLVTRDFTKSYDERREALLKANDLEFESLKAQEDIAATQLKLAKERDAINDSDADAKQAVADAEANLINVRTASFARQRELQNRITEQNNKEIAEQKAIQTEIDATAAAKKAAADKEIERSAKADEKLVIAKEKAAEERALELENAQTRADALIVIEQDRLARQLEATEGNQAEIDLIKFESDRTIAKIEKDAAKRTKDLRKTQTQTELENTNLVVDASLSALQTVFGESKALAISSAVINGALAITKILSQTGVAAPVPIALAAITTGAAVLKIATASKGMMIEGASHANGGVKMMTPSGMIEAEGGEFIMNKASTAMFKDELNAISLAGGGVPLAERGMMIEGASRQSNASNLSNDITNAVNNQQTVLVTEDLDIVQSRVRVTEDIATL